MFRTGWTYTKDDLPEQTALTDMAGSARGPEEVGNWEVVPNSLTLSAAIRSKGYVIPHFPVFFVCPRGVRPR